MQNIQEFSLGNKTYNDINDKFLIINWKNYDFNIIINTTSNANFYIGKINESDINTIAKEFQNINFTEIDNLIIEKSNDSIYEILFIEINEEEVELSFEQEKKEDQKEENKKDSKIPLYIIIISIVVGVILLLIIIIIIIRHFKKKNSDIDFTKQPTENEKLLKDL